MDWKNKKKTPLGRSLYRARYRVGEYCLRGFVATFSWLPHSLLYSFTRFAAYLSFLLLWKYRLRMEKNLSEIMGDEFATVEGRKALIYTAWQNIARGIYETIRVLYFSKEKILSTFAIQGEEHLKRALARGKGVISLSAHLGAFSMIGPRLAAAGYAFTVVAKQPKDEDFARLMDNYRAQVGIKSISARPRQLAARQILKSLRRNEIVLLVADEFKSTGVEVEFFGRSSPAPRGPVTLALRTGAALLPMFMIRDPEGLLTLHIEPELNLAQEGNLQEVVAANVAMFARTLETMVRRYPAQWNWLGFSENGERPRRKAALSKSKPSTSHPQDEHPPSAGPTF
jgi:KDO2-lipid IV(A) lauroyltransferase